MRLNACQSTPAIDAAFYRPESTLYQLQSSFHPQSTEPEPTAGARTTIVRVDGIDDVPPGPQAVENAAPRAVCVRLARAWDSLTSAPTSQRQLLFDS